jgi:hypothetical protein
MTDHAGADLQSATVVSFLFSRAAAANLDCPLRKGSTVHLPRKGRLLITGDLHDNGRNLQRIIKLAALHESADNYLILHEIIHGPHLVNGRDLSVRTLARVAELKLKYPNQVHILLANHELSQIAGAGISKDGLNVCEAFNAGIDFIYGDAADKIRAGIDRYVRSLNLAVRCDNGLFISHSLPGFRKLENFDPAVIDRELTDADLQSGGSAYDMVWGRHHSQELADQLAARWGVKVFIMGHQPTDEGYQVQGTSMLILACDHNHAQVVPVDLSKRYTLDNLLESLVPLAGVEV